MRSWLFVSAGLIFMAFNSVAQTTIVPDTSFRKYLQRNHPDLINARGLLIDSLAARFTGNLNLSNNSITSISGIQRFVRLTSINCERNQINSVDSLQNLTQLTTIICGNNPISTLPSLAKLLRLNTIKAPFCQLVAMPDLSKNLALVQLDIYNNKIAEIPGLSKLYNLLYLNCYSNQLTSMEDLSGCTKLNTFQCFNNQLSALTGVGECTLLRKFVAGNNRLTALPDLSKLTTLEELFLWGNRLSALPDLNQLRNLVSLSVEGNLLENLPDLSGNANLKNLKCSENVIKTLPDLSMLAYLEIVSFKNNQLSEVPDLTASQGTLQELYLDNNLLTVLPSLADFTNLNTLTLQSNHLTFEDILPMSSAVNFKTFIYAPQHSVTVNQTIIIKEKDSFILKSDQDATVPDLTYTWYKNNTLLVSSISPSVSFLNAKLSDAGIYTCTTTHALLPELSLVTVSTDLQVVECLSVSGIQSTIIPFECNLGAAITFDVQTLAGGTPPFKFSLTAKSTGTVLQPEGQKFTSLYEPEYVLQVTDVNGCIATKNINVDVNYAGDCEKLVIVVGQEDSNLLYLEDKGVAKIYEKNGKLIRTLSTPANWDGSNFNNEIIPGFYLVELNDKRFPVSVIR